MVISWISKVGSVFPSQLMMVHILDPECEWNLGFNYHLVLM